MTEVPDHVKAHLDTIEREARFRRATKGKNEAPAGEALRDFVLRLAGHTGPPLTDQDVRDRRKILDEMWLLVNNVKAVELRRRAEDLNNRADTLDPHGKAW